MVQADMSHVSQSQAAKNITMWWERTAGLYKTSVFPISQRAEKPQFQNYIFDSGYSRVIYCPLRRLVKLLLFRDLFCVLLLIWNAGGTVWSHIGQTQSSGDGKSWRVRTMTDPSPAEKQSEICLHVCRVHRSSFQTYHALSSVQISLIGKMRLSHGLKWFCPHWLDRGEVMDETNNQLFRRQKVNLKLFWWIISIKKCQNILRL